MSDQTQSSNQQTIIIVLAVVAVLLAGVVGFVVIDQNKKASNAPEPTGALSGSSTSKMTGGNTQAPAGMGSGAAATEAFDAKTATKVPSGMTPEQMVKAYNEAAIKGDYGTAYKMLPLAKQKSYGDVKAYGDQLKAYGITSFEMGKPVTMGDTVNISATQVTPQMPITYTWKFRKVGGAWYVESRDMGGTP
jgi:hypothetical protein